MMTVDDTKVFIDTNVFLGLYNSNDSGNVKAFIRSLVGNKNVLVTTRQAYNEFLRNRVRIIREFRAGFAATKVKEQTSSFVRSLPEHKKYLASLKALQNEYKHVVEKIDKVIEDPQEDYIYKGFVKLWKQRNTIETTDEHIARAAKRKVLGNPPGGDKFSSGDEVIWEGLLDAVGCNLIVVSKDRTYTQNKEFLAYEYNQQTGCELLVCDTVAAAFAALDIEMEPDAAQAEDAVRWLDIVVQALKQLGGRGTLKEIYEECLDLVSLFYPEKGLANNTVDSTIRRTIYNHSSDVAAYLNKEDLFHQAGHGIWALRDSAALYGAD